MASEAQHLAQFEHNLAVASRLADSEDYDWAITALFYASLHLVQTYLVRSGAQITMHAARDRYMQATADLLSVLRDYRALRDSSEHARYECRRFSRAEYESIRDGSFATVTGRLRSLLGVS